MAGKARGALRKILIVAALGAAIFFAGRAFGWWGAAEAESELKIYGNVEINEVELAFRTGGRIERLLVDEGDVVSEGDLLAQLDRGPLEAQLAGVDARLAAADAAVQRDRSGARPQEIAGSRARLADARAQLEEARRQYDRRAALIDRGFISKAEVDTARAAVQAAEARVADAEAAVSLVQAGERPEDRAMSRADRQAIEAERALAQSDLSDTRLLAPSRGQVITRVREAGSIVQAGQPVVSLALTEPVRVRAYIAQGELAKIAPGMAARVHVDGIEQPFSATVGAIATTAEFTPKSVETEAIRADLVYRVRLTVKDPQGRLRQGQPVTVTFPDARGE
ncbi:HlyD family efflux transporter periplasmic adaptor subunit [Alteriqipengyuania sp. WL0013]|uniref:HlyD family efflux transporter periplasmic adaptor subunit n=1 Tax=Alteriqipengyuania sp. WL0013 TaxID=3110773 RepID=UPI002C5332F0|nr:HlyD family efflux transporter periplasmic adaptor subunit [Alteriqipengyuania sp. WL0013]MEB3415157.1 HlyD family efflux transporter periplasmic adaptor subunit [Alteriqipengyuania sp. WL0013]